MRSRIEKGLRILRYYSKPVNMIMKLLNRSGYYVYYVKLTDYDIPKSAKFPLKTYGHSSWLRIPMYNLIDNYLRANTNLSSGRGKSFIELGGSEGTMRSIIEELGYRVEVAGNYPAVDIHHLPYDDEAF